MSSPDVASSRPALIEQLRGAGCVFAEDEADLLIDAADTAADLASMARRRAAGEPLEHVVGWAEFHGLRVLVDPPVFVPRRRTEFLVDEALVRAGPGMVVVDVCCGAGAIGLAIAAVVDGVELHAVDIDPAAVRCARRNLGGIGDVYEGDFCAPVPPRLRGHVDMLVANVPYVPTEAVALLPAEARLHESRVALDGGVDGLDLVRRLAEAASVWLAPGGHVLVETSERQAAQAVEVMTAQGLSAGVFSSDELGATVVIGTNSVP